MMHQCGCVEHNTAIRKAGADDRQRFELCPRHARAVRDWLDRNNQEVLG